MNASNHDAGFVLLGVFPEPEHSGKSYMAKVNVYVTEHVPIAKVVKHLPPRDGERDGKNIEIVEMMNVHGGLKLQGCMLRIGNDGRPWLGHDVRIPGDIMQRVANAAYAEVQRREGGDA